MSLLLLTDVVTVVMGSGLGMTVVVGSGPGMLAGKVGTIYSLNTQEVGTIYSLNTQHKDNINFLFSCI